VNENEEWDRISIKNMIFYAYHGISEGEREVGAPYEVDIDLYLDLSQAGKSDNLDDTINYQDIYHLVEHIILERRYYLLEALAQTIAEKIIEGFRPAWVTVRVRKPKVPVKGLLDHVEVEIIREGA
jgi:dihydroneopterin aldolase